MFVDQVPADRIVNVEIIMVQPLVIVCQILLEIHLVADRNVSFRQNVPGIRLVSIKNALILAKVLVERKVFAKLEIIAPYVVVLTGITEIHYLFAVPFNVGLIIPLDSIPFPSLKCVSVFVLTNQLNMINQSKMLTLAFRVHVGRIQNVNQSEALHPVPVLKIISVFLQIAVPNV